MTKTLYECLGLPVDASLGQIELAIASIRSRAHVEMRSGDPIEAQNQIRMADRAAGVLGNPGARRRYDDSIRERLPEADRQRIAARETRQREIDHAISTGEIAEHRDAYQRMLESREAAVDAKTQRERLRVQKEIAKEVTPEGKARLARQAGHRIFQFSLAMSATLGETVPMMGLLTGEKQYAAHGPILDSVEAEGWRLVHAAYVYRMISSVSRDKFLSSGQQEAVNGEIVGIYIFRLADDCALTTPPVA